MFFRQVLHPDLGCASYVVADTAVGLGAVVDPRYDVGEYLALAREHRFRIAHVLETHNHADHRSGRPRLVAATGATAWVHELADAAYDHRAFRDGDEIALGVVVLRVLHTPGHRPEHSAIIVVDGARSPDPCAVLCGDSLFVNDVARPDLAIEKEDGARELFASLRRLAALPDGVELFPGHTGGSLCGSARMSEKTSSTIGYERANNPLLRVDDEARFVRELLGGLAPQPPNFRRIVELNRAGGDGGPPPRPPTVSPERLQELADAGALVLDGRPAAEYDAGHVPGSVGVTMEAAGVGTKAAWVAPEERLVLVAGSEEQAWRMADLLAAVALTRVEAVLAGGFAAWAAAGLPVSSVQAADVHELRRLAEHDHELQILDVREDDEWDEGHIPGSTHVPYHDLGRVQPPLDAARPVAVICSTGRRAALAVGLLERAGFTHVVHVVDGGVGTWAGLGGPLVREPAAVA